MVPLAADENFNARILRGLKRRLPETDLLTVQEAGLSRTPDPLVLEWAASENRILLTHDVSTMTRYAWDRVRNDLPMPGMVAVPSKASIGTVVEDLVLVVATSEFGELEGQVLYLPL